ncbi:MAG: histidine phosphotransferase family protein [Wolbachia pipientis]|nr:histidine phosphotransferase family protein [Wolbachia pipientis]
MKKKVKFTWEIDEHSIKNREDLTEKINKIISNMALTITNVIAEVELVSVLLSQIKGKTLLTIRILNKQKLMSKSLANKLTKKDNINLNIKNVNVYMTSLLLEHYNTKIKYSYKKNLLKIDLVIS